MAAVREERRLVTCMFVDVVGSTQLTMQLGAERFKRELGAAFTDLSGIITAHGGTVEKYVGDAIYAIFGAPVAHEDDPLRALRAAEALREWSVTGRSILPGGPAQRVPFAVRVGVETGEAVVDLEAAATTKQQMSVGAVVNIAARLQQRAEPGEILVGPRAREAAADVVELEELGAVELKGIGTLPVWRLVRVGAPRTPALPFVGREAELALLGHAFQRAHKGRSVLAVVSGPAGQGKTRLVQEFLNGQACRVIPTRCRPADEVGVFAPVRQILGVTTLDALADQVGRLCSNDVECERVVAGLAESAGIATSRSLSELPAAEREDEIVQAWRRYVALVGGDGFVVLAIDDIHWADPSLVRLVDRLTFGGPRLLVVATARPEFAESSGIRPSGDRFFIELEGLEPEEARRLAALAGRDDERVVARAEGNPLFVVELARSTHQEELPLTLQGALGARLDQLAPADRTLVSLAAVAGERFTAADAAFLTQHELAGTGRALAHLTDLHFLDLTETGYRFHHGLVRDVAYGRLLTAERMKAHARFARARVHPEDAERLAYHWWEALRPPDGEWVWGDDPGLPAMRREAFQAHLAAARRHAEHFAVDRAIELGERAAGFAGDDQERAAAHEALALAYQRVLRQDDTWAHLRKALDLYRDAGGVPPRLYVALVEAAVYYGAFKKRPSDDEVFAVADEGVAAARAAADARLVARILLARAQYMTTLHSDEPELVATSVEAAAAAADESGDAGLARRALDIKLSALTSAGRFDEAAPLIELSSRKLLGTDALERLFTTMRLATYHLAMAEREAHEAAVAEALALAEPMGPHNHTHAWAQATEMYAARGEWEKVVGLAHRTAKLVREGGGSMYCGLAALILHDGAIAHALAGAREEALALLRAIPLTSAPVPQLYAMVPYALLGHPYPEADAKLAERRRTWFAWWWGAARAVILGRPDAAERALAEMGRAAETAVAYRSFAEGVHEAVAEMRGGPPATYEALRKIGYTGWIDILKRRVDAEY